MHIQSYESEKLVLSVKGLFQGQSDWNSSVLLPTLFSICKTGSSDERLQRAEIIS